MEEGKHPFLEMIIKIYQEIAATNEVEVHEGRIAGDILPGKNYQFPDGFRDLHHVVLMAEVFL